MKSSQNRTWETEKLNTYYILRLREYILGQKGRYNSNHTPSTRRRRNKAELTIWQLSSITYACMYTGAILLGGFNRLKPPSSTVKFVSTTNFKAQPSYLQAQSNTYLHDPGSPACPPFFSRFATDAAEVFASYACPSSYVRRTCMNTCMHSPPSATLQCNAARTPTPERWWPAATWRPRSHRACPTRTHLSFTL